MRDAELKETIRELEAALLRPEVRHSVEQLDTLLADEFVEIGSSGRVYDKGQTVAALQGESEAQILMEDFQVRLLAPGVVLALCRTTRGDRRQARRSSIWKLVEGRWQVVFHQGTPVEEE